MKRILIRCLTLSLAMLMLIIVGVLTINAFAETSITPNWTQGVYATENIQLLCSHLNYISGSTYWTNTVIRNCRVVNDTAQGIYYDATDESHSKERYSDYHYRYVNANGATWSECWGFADYIGYLLSGKDPETAWTRIKGMQSLTNMGGLYVGDIIRSNGHSAFVYAISDSGDITFLQAGGRAKNIITIGKWNGSAYNGYVNTGNLSVLLSNSGTWGDDYFVLRAPDNNGGNFRYSIEACVGDGGVIYLKGWVYNSENVTRSIQIHAYLDGGPGSGAQCWAIPANVARTDIDSIYHIGAYHGFEYNIKGVSQGQHILQLFANDQYLNDSKKIGDYQVTVGSDSFVTVIEECRGATNAIYLKGWAQNNNNVTNSIQIHVYLDGPVGSSTQCWAVPANVSRKDLDAIYKTGEYHGFDYYVTEIQPGNHTIYLYVNDQFRDTHEELGVYNVLVEDNIPKPVSLTVTPSDNLLSLMDIDNKEDLETQTAYYSAHIQEHLTVEVNYSDGTKQTVSDYAVDTWIEHSEDKPLYYGFVFSVSYGELTDTSEIGITLKPKPVYDTPDFKLPSVLTVIDESAFEGISASVVYISDNCANIGKWAFRNCPNLTQIRIPTNCAIGTDTFAGCNNVMIFGTKGSAAEAYANSHANCTFVAE